MKMPVIRMIIIPTFLLLVFGQCAEPDTANTVPEPQPESETPTPAAVPSFMGVYKGVLPCADCEGIETELTLSPDNQFIFRTAFLGKANRDEQTQSGPYSVQTKGAILTLIGVKPPNRYEIGDQILYLIDLEGNKIKGASTETISLHRVTE